MRYDWRWVESRAQKDRGLLILPNPQGPQRSFQIRKTAHFQIPATWRLGLNEYDKIVLVGDNVLVPTVPEIAAAPQTVQTDSGASCRQPVWNTSADLATYAAALQVSHGSSKTASGERWRPSGLRSAWSCRCVAGSD